MVELEGTKVRIRTFRDTDVEALHAYRDDADTAAMQGWDVPYSRAQAEEFVTWASGAPLAIPGSWAQLAVERRDEPGTLIGDVGVHTLMDEPTTVEIGVTVATAARGAGVATEAVQLVLDHLAAEHGIVRARALIVVDNLPSVALFERLGFEQVGTRMADDGLEEHVYEHALG